MGERQAPRVGGTRPPKNPSRNPSSSPSPTPTFRAPQIGPFLLPSYAPRPPPPQPPASLHGLCAIRFERSGKVLTRKIFPGPEPVAVQTGITEMPRGKKKKDSPESCQGPDTPPIPRSPCSGCPPPGTAPSSPRSRDQTAVLKGSPTELGHGLPPRSRHPWAKKPRRLQGPTLAGLLEVFSLREKGKQFGGSGGP